MTDAGDKLIEGAKEALAVAKGDAPAHRLYVNGHTYVPVEEAIARDERFIDLAAKAKTLVDMLDDAERNHGGLYAAKTMRASNELRLELAKWK